MATEPGHGLSAAARDGSWSLVGPAATDFELVNDYLTYLADRRYSPRTVRSYAFDLLHFCRWLCAEGTGLNEVKTDTLLRSWVLVEKRCYQASTAPTCLTCVAGARLGTHRPP